MCVLTGTLTGRRTLPFGAIAAREQASLWGPDNAHNASGCKARAEAGEDGSLEPPLPVGIALPDDGAWKMDITTLARRRLRGEDASLGVERPGGAQRFDCAQVVQQLRQRLRGHGVAQQLARRRHLARGGQRERIGGD